LNPTSLTLTYGKKPIRVLIVDDKAWFAAADVFAAMKCRTDRPCLARMAPEHLRLLTFDSPAGPVRLTAVSPLGVATIAATFIRPVDLMLDGWVRRVTAELSEEHGIEPLPYCMLADDRLPAKPRGYADLIFPWKKLEFEAQRLRIRRREPNLYEPALFDDDPSLPPHNPDAQQGRVAALIEAGEPANAR